MNSEKLFTWIQAVTGVAVLIGLGLVIWELQQTRTLARIQVISDTRALNIQSQLLVLGEEPIDVLYKACVDPGSLSIKDKLALDYFFLSMDERMVRLYQMERFGGLSLPIGYGEGPTQEFTENQITMGTIMRELVKTDAGQRWYTNMRDRWRPEMRRMGDAVLQRRRQQPTCKDRIEELFATPK